MALNLSDRIAVRRVISDRCTAACANYALYLLGGTPTTAQLAWAREAMRAPAEWGERTSWYVLNQPDFISGGSSIADNVLSGAVETAINTFFIASA
jgi:hypothetical protein